jgi:sigma-E factor negative regulatory protein RseC
VVEARATVVAIGLPGQVWVETRPQSGCGSCASASGCGTATLARLFGNRASRVMVEDPLGAQVGQEVTIAIAETRLVSGAARLYLLPLLAFFLSASVAEWVALQWLVSVQEWAVVLAAVAGSGAVVWWMRWRGWFEQEALTPLVTKLHPVQYVGFFR